MKKINICIALLLCVSTSTLLAKGFGRSDGDSDIPKSTVKLNLYSLAYKTLSLQYEYILGAKTSVALGLRYSAPRKAPSLFLTDPSGTSASAGDFSDIRFGGYALTPEFRYYVSKQAGKGFYFAPFLRYEAQTMKSKFVLQDGSTSTVDLNGKLGGLGLGLQLGAHFSLSEKISLDWWIFGPYYKMHKLNLNASNSAGFNLTATDIEDIKSSVASLDNPIINDFRSTVTNTNIDINAKTKLPGVRTGLCFGFRF